MYTKFISYLHSREIFSTFLHIICLSAMIIIIITVLRGFHKQPPSLSLFWISEFSLFSFV